MEISGPVLLAATDLARVAKRPQGCAGGEGGAIADPMAANPARAGAGCRRAPRGTMERV